MQVVAKRLLKQEDGRPEWAGAGLVQQDQWFAKHICLVIVYYTQKFESSGMQESVK